MSSTETTSPPSPSPESVMLTAEQLHARWLGQVSLQTIHSWRSKGRGPAFVRLESRRVVYRLDDVVAYENAQRVTRGE